MVECIRSFNDGARRPELIWWYRSLFFSTFSLHGLGISGEVTRNEGAGTSFITTYGLKLRYYLLTGICIMVQPPSTNIPWDSVGIPVSYRHEEEPRRDFSQVLGVWAGAPRQVTSPSSFYPSSEAKIVMQNLLNV